MEDVDCVIPAAGRSERMGAWKPLLPFGGRTLIETVVATALEVCAGVVLVAGYRGEELAARFRGDSRVRCIQNEAWPLGMFSSLHSGVAAVRTRRFFVTLGDMPWISAGVYRALLEENEGDVLFPAYGGRRGHPVLFGERVKAVVSQADPSQGNMRSIAEAFHPRELSWPDDSILRDVDRPDDLR